MMDALPLFDARRAGLKEGMQKGLLAGERNKAIETTKELLKMNLLTIEQIAKATQLSTSEVLEIKNSLNE